MGWILLLLIIIVGAILFVSSRREKKKQHALWASRQKDSYVPPMPVTSLETVDGANKLVVNNDSNVYFTQYEKGKAAWPGGVANLSVYFNKDTKHLLILSLVQESDQIDFGEVTPEATEKFLAVFQSMGGHLAQHYELLTLNKVDSSDLNLAVKSSPAKVYLYTENSAYDGKKRLFFSPDPTSTAYKLLGVAVSNDPSGDKGVDLSLEDSKGVKSSVYTTLTSDALADLQANFVQA